MRDYFIPTCELRFVKREARLPDVITPVDRMILQQKFISTVLGTEIEWRDVPLVDKP